MDKDIKEKWVKALRSGEYKQGRGALIDGDGAMCCVGVLAHVMGKANEWLHEHSCKIGPSPLNSRDADQWPKGFPFPSEVRPMVDMNDAGSSFSEIADWIEEHL